MRINFLAPNDYADIIELATIELACSHHGHKHCLIFEDFVNASTA